MDFTSLGVPAPLAAALAARGITEPTEIQREVIPAACAGECLIGEAPTGTGKTLAYLLPALMRIDPAVRAASVFSRSTSFASTSEMTAPVLPARAVRPAR